MLVANVRLFWKPSVSTDVVKRVVKVVADGATTEIELPLTSSEHILRLKANSSLQFSTEVTDVEGKVAQSVTYSTTIGDLTDPLPDTDLGHEILSVEDVPEEVPVEPAPVV